MEWETFICWTSIYAEALDKRVSARMRDVYSIRSGDRVRHIPVERTLFFETAVKPHHVILHSVDGWLDFIGRLNDIERRLDGSFIRTHRSYLVNRKKITEMDLRHNRIKVGDGVCLVSRKMKSVLLEKLDGGLV